MFEHAPFKNGQLTGHNSPESAYTVPDYPYGFRARTTIRYWVETTKHGQRAVSQTLNPKTNRWNKPKAGTYSDIIVMGFDENNHVTFDGVSMGCGESEILRFAESFKLDEYQTKKSVLIQGFARGQKYITYTVKTVTDDSPRQTLEEQREITKKAALAGLSEVLKEKDIGVKDVI